MVKFNEEEYVKGGWNNCPYCDSDKINAGRPMADCNYAWSRVTCENCHRSWQDNYILTSVEEIERG